MRSEYARKVILVGHCGPDMHMLRAAVQRVLGGMGVEVANDAGALEAHLTPDSLLLVNRVLDDGFDTESGVELIATLARREQPPVMMLISNHADAQEQAVAAGARRGFGKAELYRQNTAEALRAAVNGTASGE